MKQLLIVLTLALCISIPVSAGVVFEVETTDHENGGRVESTQTYVEGKNLKMEIAAGGGRSGGEAIYRGDWREMVVVDHDDKSYMVMDEEALTAVAGQVSQALGQLEDALKHVPEGQRAELEKLMKGRMPQQAPSRPASEVRKTGERAEMQGYPCVKYEVWRAGARVRELWVTNWKNVEGGEEVIDTFEDVAKFFSDLADSLSDATGFPGLGDSMGDNLFEHMTEIDGFPIVTREFGDDDSLDSETTLRSSRRRTLDPADFEPPSGYKRRSMFPQ